MNECMKTYKYCISISLILCMLLFLPFLLFAHDKEDPAKTAARKAALSEFFGKSLCLECHGSTPTYNIKWARTGYDRSMVVILFTLTVMNAKNATPMKGLLNTGARM